MIYWENYPLLHIKPSHVSFEDDMRQCIKLSETNDNMALAGLMMQTVRNTPAKYTGKWP